MSQNGQQLTSIMMSLTKKQKPETKKNFFIAD